MRPEARSETSEGFTLIEVIVAFTILALSLAAVMQAFSTGLGGLRTSQAHGLALMQARSKLSEVGSAITLEEGEIDGELDDGSNWRVSIEKTVVPEDQGLDQAESFGLVMYDVSIEVRGPDDVAVSLKTRRLTQAPL